MQKKQDIKMTKNNDKMTKKTTPKRWQKPSKKAYPKNGHEKTRKE